MKKFLALVLCCLMTCGIAFAEEENVEPRPYYEMPKIEFDFKDEACNMESTTRYESRGYCFLNDLKEKPVIAFVFILTPLECENTWMKFTGKHAIQNGKDLKVATLDLHLYPGDGDLIVGDWTDPAVTNGFKVPRVDAYAVGRGEFVYMCMAFNLDNLEDDVTLDMSYYGIDPFTVPIPDDAFLEPSAQ